MKTWFALAQLSGKTLLLCLVILLSSLSFAAETKAKSDQELFAWVDKVAQKTSAYNQVEIIKSREVNAWVTENGKIHVTTGILAFCQNDDELAGVFLHEMGHLQLGHFEEARRHQEEFKQAIERAAFFSRNSSIDNSDTIQASAKIVAAIAVPYFGHKYEYAADKYAYCNLLDKGMNPMALSDLFDRMAKSNIDSKLLSLLFSHPSFSSRIEKFESYNRERRAFEQFSSNCFRLKPDEYSQAVQRGNLDGYRIEPFKAGKKMTCWLFLSEGGMSYKKGTLQVVPSSNVIILLRKSGGKDLLAATGVRLGDLRIYTRDAVETDDYAIMINSSAFTSGVNQIEIYCTWRGETRRGVKDASDTVKIKIALPKNAAGQITVENKKPDNVDGTLEVESPYPAVPDHSPPMAPIF